MLPNSIHIENTGSYSDFTFHGERKRGMSILIVDSDIERGDAVSAVICTLRPHGATPRIARVTEVDVLQMADVDVVLIALDEDKEKAQRLVDAVVNAGVSPLVYGEVPDGELMVHCMRAGVREFLHYPFEQDALQEALRRWTSRGQPTPVTSRKIGRSLVFFGAKGGSGTTTAACNFAVELAQTSGRRTLLIDLDLPLGDAALCLGAAINEFSALDALRQSERLDAAYLSKLAWKHESGLHVLGAPGRYVRMLPMGKAVDHLLTVAATTFDYVVIDAGSRLELAETRLFESASGIYLVTQANISELRNANRLITECLQEYSAKTEIVWNRYTGAELGIDDRAVKGALTMPVRWKIPNDYAAVRRMQYMAEPVGNSRVQRVARTMAMAVCGKQAAHEKNGRWYDVLRARLFGSGEMCNSPGDSAQGMERIGALRAKLFGSAGESSSPGNFSPSLPAMAARMKSIQIGSAATAPVSLSPSDSRLS